MRNKDYEFEADFLDHEIGEGNIYRLYYINYYRRFEGYTKKSNNIGVINWPFWPFMMPEGMTREDGFKVLSYLTDFIESTGNINSNYYLSVSYLNDALNLERLGFKKVKETDEDKIINLFTVTGRVLLFKNDPLYTKYFDWYTPNVTKEEVEMIYHKCGLTFADLVWRKNPTRTLKK